MKKKEVWEDVKKADPENHLGLTYDDTKTEMLKALENFKAISSAVDEVKEAKNEQPETVEEKNEEDNEPSEMDSGEDEPVAQKELSPVQKEIMKMAGPQRRIRRKKQD